METLLISQNHYIDNMKDYIEPMIEFLERYDKRKKEEVFIPTVEMLIEELKSKL